MRMFVFQMYEQSFILLLSFTYFILTVYMSISSAAKNYWGICPSNVAHKCINNSIIVMQKSVTVLDFNFFQ